MDTDSINAILSLKEEILKNRKDIKSAIEASETRLLMKVEELNQKVQLLEEENNRLKNKVEKLEIYSKKNNIIIFGLHNKENTPTIISERLNTLLEVDVRVSDFNNSYKLNNTEKPPVKVEFLSYLKKLEILKQCKKLKGSGIAISNDLTFEQRREYRILRTYLSKAREDPTDRSYIKGNKLYVNDRVYTVKELEEQTYSEVRNTNSAPATPNLRNPGQEFERPVSISQEDPKAAVNKKAAIDTHTPKSSENKNNKLIADGTVLYERTRSQRSNK